MPRVPRTDPLASAVPGASGAPTVLKSATCPDCGAPVAHQSGCERCVACGWSRCG